jgi:hypothetical protein
MCFCVWCVCEGCGVYEKGLCVCLCVRERERETDKDKDSDIKLDKRPIL